MTDDELQQQILTIGATKLTLETYWTTTPKAIRGYLERMYGIPYNMAAAKENMERAPEFGSSVVDHLIGVQQ